MEVKDPMKRVFLLAALLLCAFALSGCQAGDPSATSTPIPTASPSPTPSPTPDPTKDPTINEDMPPLDPTEPGATPVAIDPIDMPTPTPKPTANVKYDDFSSSAAGFKFSKPNTWIQTSGTVAEFVQFVEPSAEASQREDSGYPARLTMVKYQKGTKQTSDDAKAQLESVMDEMTSEFLELTVNTEYGSLSMGGGKGYYVYYKGVVADPTDPNKTYSVRGRAGVVAKDQALYQIRLSTPADYFDYYQEIYRTARNSFKVL